MPTNATKKSTIKGVGANSKEKIPSHKSSQVNFTANSFETESGNKLLK